jgi:ribosomal-protein-alanine N-acetyltransferase
MTDHIPPRLRDDFNFAVRRAGPDDIKAIVSIEENSFTADAWPEEALAAEMGSPGSRFFLATDNSGTPAGYVIAHRRRWRRLGEIFSIAVHSDFRNHGLGKTLLDAACDDLRARGARKIRLNVRTDNAAAIHLYEKSGFAVTGTEEHYYSDEADALVMTLECK